MASLRQPKAAFSILTHMHCKFIKGPGASLHFLLYTLTSLPCAQVSSFINKHCHVKVPRTPRRRMTVQVKNDMHKDSSNMLQNVGEKNLARSTHPLQQDSLETSNKITEGLYDCTELKPSITEATT